MSSDVWSRPEACLAATRVFRLAEEYPALRPRSTDVAAAVAASLGERDGTVPRPAVEEVIAAIPDADADRLVALAAGSAPERWRALVGEAGPEEAREPLLVGVATTAVAELQPPPRWLASMRESTADTAPGPLNVLASLLFPKSVWSIDEARAAQTLAAPSLPLEQRLRVVMSFAQAELAPVHLERAWRVAEPVARILPLDGAPATSRDLGRALALLHSNAEATAELCELLLLTYVMSLEGLVPTVPSPN